MKKYNWTPFRATLTVSTVFLVRSGLNESGRARKLVSILKQKLAEMDIDVEDVSISVEKVDDKN